MWPYWLMFLLPAVAALREQGRSMHAAVHRRLWSGTFVCAGLVLAVLIGYRYQVGGDWGAYQRQLEEIQLMSLEQALTQPDPGYVVLNWISTNMGLGIYGVNLVCGAIFSFGLLHFCRSLPRPWLAVTVAVPYMLVVVGMGYTRQAVALGFSMIGLVALKNRSIFWFIFWGALGAIFHKSAVLMLPIAALANSRNRFWNLVLVLATTYVGYLTLLQDSFDSLYVNYVGSDVQSEGAMIRLLMNAVPSLLLLGLGERFEFSRGERNLWRWMAAISVALLGALVVVPSASTAVDRMALYMLPIQVVVFAQLPRALHAATKTSSSLVAAGIVGYYALVLFVWLNFAIYAPYWLPYRFYPLEVL